MSDDRAQMRARFPVPADRDLPPGRHLLYRDSLMSQILSDRPGSQPGSSEPHHNRRPSPRRSIAWHPSARVLLATAAAVAVFAGLGVTAADRLSAHPAGPSAPTAAAAPPVTAVAVLDRVAQAASAGPAVKVGPNQYFYVKAQVASTSIFAKSGTVEGWIAQSQAKETLWVDNGQRTIQKAGTAFEGYGGPIIGAFFNGLGPGAASRDKLLYPTYAYLESLPTNPRQLLSLIRQQPAAHGGIYPFLFIGQLVSTAVLPPQTAATLYRAAALIPGVTVVPDATDALGRHGVAIAMSSVEGHFHLREEWIFSTSTYQFLGARTTVKEPSVKNPAQYVTTTSASAVLARGIANSPGGTPTLIK